jgi:hypothetical protein
VGSGHPLLGAAAQAAIERAASAHRGRRWVSQGFTSLDDRASHPCGILHGTPFSVFAKLSPAADAREQFTAELAGLRLLSRAAPVPVPVASGLAETPAGTLLLYEALPTGTSPPSTPASPGGVNCGAYPPTRLPAYLAIVAVDGPGLFGRRYLDRLAAAVRSYR